MERTILTLGLIFSDDRILLGMKKRGFGAGRWNGFGGKLQSGESLEDGLRREVEEECGLTVLSCEKVALHEFRFARNPDEVLEVHVFRVGRYEGEPVETEEMIPRWFTLDTIPYDEMWPDDRLWLPQVLAGQKLCTRFLFGEGDKVLEEEVKNVKLFEES